jgi:hypothetical protein
LGIIFAYFTGIFACFAGIFNMDYLIQFFGIYIEIPFLVSIA